jgi:enoyl-CoA hydratase
MINASEALDWGLLNKVVAPGKTVSESKEILQLIGSKGPTAVTKVIDVVAAYYNKNSNGFQEEIKAFGKLSATDEFKEGTQAFIENREAKFKN